MNCFTLMLFGQDVLLRSNLETAECWRRLEGATIRETFISRSHRERTVIARIKKPRIRLRLEPTDTILSYNSLTPCFYGRIEATPTGSLIVGQLRYHSWVYYFLGCWYAMWLFLNAPLLLDAWRQLHGLENNLRVSPLEIMMIAAFFALAPCLVMILGYNRAAEQRVVLLNFMKRTTSAFGSEL